MSKTTTSGIPVEDGLAGLIADLIEKTKHDQHRLVEAKDGTQNLLILDAAGELAEVINLSESQFQAAPPPRKTGSFRFGDPQSFIDFYKMHESAAPVYAELDKSGMPRFTAVLNDHTKDQADHRDFRASFTPAFATEWVTWTGHSGKDAAFASPKDFALFIQDNAPDFVSPSSADMLSLALNFRIKSDGVFNCAQRLQDGHMQLTFNHVVTAQATNAAGGEVTIPDQFTLSLPVYEMPNAGVYTIQARLNFRTNGQGVTLWYELVRPRKVLLTAFQDAWKQIAAATGAKMLLGAPN